MSGSGGREKSYEPDFDISYTSVTPAIGIAPYFLQKRAYVQVWLPTQVLDNESMEFIGWKRMPWMIFDNGAKTLFLEKELLKEKLIPTSKPIEFQLRWSIEDINLFTQKPDEPVDAVQVYQSIIELFQTYIEFPAQEYYSLVALWVIGTYFQPLWNTYPFLYIGGTKGVGKTKTLKVIDCLAFNSVNSLSVSSAALYRICEGSAATLLVDETGYLKSRTRYEDLRTLLYGRYKRGQTVQRVEKTASGQQKVQFFHVFGPTALANIEGLEDVLADRVIEIILLRSLNRNILNVEVDDNNPVFERTRNKLYRLWMTRWQTVQKEYTEYDTCSTCSTCDAINNNILYYNSLSGRAMERWKPILALAKWLEKEGEKDLHTKMLAFAVKQEEIKREEDVATTAEATLVTTLLDMVKADDFYPVREIKKKMLEKMEEQPAWLTVDWVGRALKRLGFNERRRVGTSRQVRLTPQSVRESAQRIGVIVAESGKVLMVCNVCSEGKGTSVGAIGICELCGRAGELFRIEQK